MLGIHLSKNDVFRRMSPEYGSFQQFPIGAFIEASKICVEGIRQIEGFAIGGTKNSLIAEDRWKRLNFNQLGDQFPALVSHQSEVRG